MDFGSSYWTPKALAGPRQWWQGPLPASQALPVPASYNDLFVESKARDHVGDVWYQRTVFVPTGWSGRRIVLRFDAATHRAAVWVGDEMVVEHEGGYTPFEADITSLALPGEEVRITIVVNNELHFQSIPPGVIQELPDGSKRQRYYHDFFNYSGLHRSVWLYATSPTYLSDLTVITDVESGTGIVRYSTVVDGGAPTVRVTLCDADGVEVATGDGEGRGTSGAERAPVGARSRVSPRTTRRSLRR